MIRSRARRFGHAIDVLGQDAITFEARAAAAPPDHARAYRARVRSCLDAIAALEALEMREPGDEAQRAARADDDAENGIASLPLFAGGFL